MYKLVGQQINLPGFKQLDRLSFDTINLRFENEKLHDVGLYVPNRFKDVIFKNTYEQFNSKYGRVTVVDEKKRKSKKYIWDLGSNELSLTDLRSGLLILYSNKTSS